MKVPLAHQIEEAERHRDELWGAVSRNFEPQSNLDRAEAIVLTLRWLQVYEPDFRQYMDERKEMR